MNIIDLQRIIYPTSPSLKTVKNDYFYFNYSYDLTISIKKTHSNHWNLSWYERGIEQSTEIFPSEYLVCLNFLYEIDKISSNDPNKMKILALDSNWILFEKNQIFYLHALSPDYRKTDDLSISLNDRDLEQLRNEGLDYLSKLHNSIFKNNLYSIYQQKQISQELFNEINCTITQNIKLPNSNLIIEKSKNSVISPSIFLFLVGIIIYIVQKYL